MKHRLFILLFVYLFYPKVQAQYITEVIEYVPAPGQFINKAPWGLPESANSIIGTVNGALSLGAYGGYVVFKFENPVLNNINNPFGIDFTIFGNPMTDWAEPGIVYVMRDDNNNGLPDDTWYEIAGSDYFFSSTKHDYEITYHNPGTDYASPILWEDNYGFSSTILPNGTDLQPYYPQNNYFPIINPISQSYSGTKIEGKVNAKNPINIKSFHRAFGYADNKLRGNAPYTIPDNPYTKERENAGGDGIDISWAVDKNGEYVDLDCIHFVKVQTGMAQNASNLGEISTEITGAVVVEPNALIYGINKMVVIQDLPDTITYSNFPLKAFCFINGRLQKNENIFWQCSISTVSIIDNKIVFEGNGPIPITITAFMESDPTIFCEVNAIVKKDYGGIYPFISNFNLYPNPASSSFKIDIDANSIEIIDITGKVLFYINNYKQNQPIGISSLNNGLYVVRIITNTQVSCAKLIVR